jgi:hypothetical protein
MLGRPIYVAAGIGVGRSRRAEVYDEPAVAGDHAWQHGAGDIHQALDVSIDHRIPGVEISILGGVETGRKACVVDEQVEFSKVRRQASDRCFDRGSIPDVKNDGM